MLLLLYLLLKQLLHNNTKQLICIDHIKISSLKNMTMFQWHVCASSPAFPEGLSGISYKCKTPLLSLITSPPSRVSKLSYRCTPALRSGWFGCILLTSTHARTLAAEVIHNTWRSGTALDIVGLKNTKLSDRRMHYLITIRLLLAKPLFSLATLRAP